jgi:hypothetical protein
MPGGYPLPGVEDLPDLPLKPRGRLVGVIQFEKILPDGLFELQSPEIEQRLIDEQEAAFFIERVRKVADR